MVSEEKIREALRQVIDPELHFNIVELGLVYEIKVSGGDVKIVMSLTSPACPAGPQMIAQAETVARQVEGVKNAEIEITFEPPWNPKMASGKALEALEDFL
ncbi:MAG: metal-sulfur cluster assembly factor [Candidatus Diapherotrites archaeon]|nr:metal-sulfur cluster assembly factor [Candidatus Diapherotrites archaeon]